MTDNFPRVLLSVLLLLALSGCARFLESVDTTYNRSVDFSALETYDWASLQGAEETATDDLLLIRRLIDNDLQEKGLREVDDNPDFMIVVLLRKTRQVETHENRVSRSGGQLYETSSPTHGEAPVTWQYEEGTLVVNFARPQTNQLVWRGKFRTDLNSASTPRKRSVVIERAVKKIMKAFPPS